MLITIPAPQQWDPDNPNPHDLPQPPRRENGDPYAFEIVYDDDQGRRMRGYADDVGDLLEAVCGSAYADGDDQERAVLRAVLSMELAAQLQVSIVAGDPDLYNALSDDEQAAVDHPRTEPCPLTEWSSELPLVLSDIHYSPHTALAPVRSGLADVADPPNILWLRPAEEWGFLTSLQRAAIIAVHTRG